jgi:polyphosphate kinase
MDLEARAHWVDYAEAKDEMFARTDTEDSPWFVVEAVDKRTARLNLISHLLERIPYEQVPTEKLELPPRQERPYVRPPIDTQTFVPTRYLVE